MTIEIIVCMTIGMIVGHIFTQLILIPYLEKKGWF